MQFNGEEEIDSVVTEARELYRATPKCFLRHLRLCCVSTTELMPQPVQFQTRHKPSAYTLNVNEFDRNLSLQAARSVLMLSTQELVNSVAPIHFAGEGNAHQQSETIPEQFVIIDIRAYEDTVTSGGGILPRAIQLEPEFLQRPDAFDIWLQHFDGTRGCNICIIDLPPARWTGVALWRRLLLGEGDGTTVESTSTDLPAVAKHGSRHGNSGGNTNGGRSADQRRDAQSAYAAEEAEIARLDLTRPAVQLALALQAHSFPNVSVLDGGFPALIEQLVASRGTVEPVVINHDEDQWARFLRSTGRDYKTIEQSRRGSMNNTVNKNADNSAPYEKRRTVRDLSKLEVYKYALKVADRLNHPFMRGIIAEKVNALDAAGQQDVDSTAAATESKS
jgi:hypothetical protein